MRLPPWIEPRTAYIHIPFCAHRCGYCDFAISVGDESAIPLYLEALALELATLQEPRTLETAFLGGGTPSHLGLDHLRQLFEHIRRWLNIEGEFSFEANPDSLDEAKVALLAEVGITRLSLGVQSFQPHLLASLDRRHSSADIAGAVALARKYGLDLSIDLIFAAPGATLADWKADLTQALELQPDHISTYGLTFEKGTPLWKSRERGLAGVVKEDEELRMYESAIDLLATAGYEHYEISNFAKPGKRCVHNERYWKNHAYYGFGVGAARYVNGSRELNVRNTRDYIRKLLAGESPTFQTEVLDPRERAIETMAVRLRHCDGIPREEFRDETGFELEAICGSRLPMLFAEGLLEAVKGHIRLTRKGKYVADGVIEELMKG